MNVPRGTELARSAARWAGLSLADTVVEALERYADWLVEEAIPAGGLGPREADRVWSRHIADSLVFAAALPHDAATIADVGTGVGLPGIPLALAMPESEVWLVDRGGRRIRLLERVVRIMELANVVVLHRDVADLSGSFPALTFRGSVPRAQIARVASRLLAPAGSAAFGLSRRPELPEDTQELLDQLEGRGLHGETIRVPDEVLDAPSWLLKISHRG